MSDPKNNGKTLWEMLRDKLNKPELITFYDPLAWRIGAMAPIADKEPDFAGFDFTVKEIHEYTRRIGGQEFHFTDYVMAGANTKTFDVDDQVTLRLRVVPNPAGGCEKLLLRVDDEFAFNEAFLEVVKDPSGVFNVTEDDTGATIGFNRINDVKDSYEAVVLLITATTPEGKVLPGELKSAKVEYWDFWRDAPIGQTNKTQKEFLFVEMNSDTGWFQIWKGHEFFL